MDVGVTNGESEPRTTTPALINCLIMYEYRQSRGRLTSGLKSALRLYAYKQQQTRAAIQIAMLNGLVQANREAMKEIIAEAQNATPERGMELLKQAKQLQKQARRLGKQLEELSK